VLVQQVLLYHGDTTMTTQVTGYTYRTNDVAHSPLTLEDLNLLKQTVLLTEDDEKYLRLAGEVLADQIDAVLDEPLLATCY
jgi:adenosylmethionine-8-amino-7-oxononanoate aminotransferase